MVGLVIVFPGMVMHYKGVGSGVDPNSIQDLGIPQMETMPPLDFGPPGALPGLEPPGDAPPASPAWSRRRRRRLPYPAWSPTARRHPAAGQPLNDRAQALLRWRIE